MIEFTARNGKQLSRQIDEANAALGENPITVAFGKAVSGDRLWYVHGEGGRDLKTSMRFEDLVAEVRRRFDTALECAAL